MFAPPVMQNRSNYLFLFLYLLFIIYGSLFPLAGWRTPEHGLLVVWQQALGQHLFRSDLLTNILVYCPLGFLLVPICSKRFGTFATIMASITLGALLSFSMEYIQLFLPARTSSAVDLLLNIVSTAIGAVAYRLLDRQADRGEWFGEWRHNHFDSGGGVDIGLAVIALWGTVQLAPFVPSLDFGTLKNGLKPLWQTVHDLSRFNWYRAGAYTLNIGALGAALLLLIKQRKNAPLWLCVYCGAVLLAKATIVGRQLSLEAMCGLVCGVMLTIGLRGLPRGGVAVAGFAAVAAAFTVEELRPDMTTVELHDFNWVPFSSQMMDNVSGMGGIIEGLWPFASLAFFAMTLSPDHLKRHPFVTGLLPISGVIALEYAQTGIAGRYPDITTIILAVIGWSIPLLLLRENA